MRSEQSERRFTPVYSTEPKAKAEASDGDIIQDLYVMTLWLRFFLLFGISDGNTFCFFSRIIIVWDTSFSGDNYQFSFLFLYLISSDT